MDRRNLTSESGIDSPIFLHRSPSTLDLSSIFHKTRRASHRQSVSFASSNRSENNGSETSQPLYMAPPKRSKSNRQSLSSIGNRPGRSMDGQSDDKAKSEHEPVVDTALKDEELTWNIIDQEIFEWQYVCETGRPYCWSPEAKYTRLHTKSPESKRMKQHPRIWLRHMDDRARPEYHAKRRSVSDTFIADPSSTDNMAHLIAVQLLSSCFTLPLSPETGESAPNYSLSPHVTDPRMISSLRMHTQYRFSPSFGHEARNTSPSARWSDTYDGPTGSSAYRASKLPPIDIPVAVSRRRRRVYRKKNVSKDTTASLDEGSSRSHSHDRDSQAESSTTNRRELGDQHFQRDHLPYFAGKAEKDIESPKLPLDQASNAGTPPPSRQHYRLHPVIRSEPHHVYVQPVREMVVKRWKSFRRRFGGSLHAPLPLSRSPVSENYTSGSGASSPAMSSDGKARRRRAQERGEIHSSADSTTHYNSEASESAGLGSPNIDGTPDLLSPESNKSSPMFPLADPLVAAAALAFAEGHTEALTSNSALSSAASSGSSSMSTTPLLLSPPSADMPGSSNSLLTKPRPTLCTFTSRKKQVGQRRNSRLSEMYTAGSLNDEEANREDHAADSDNSILNAVGSALKSAQIALTDSGEADSASLPSALQDDTPPSPPASPTSTSRSFVDILNTSSRRPRLARTSTSGTQVFRPTDVGVEVDGLPVGPSKDMWDRKGT